MAAGDFHVPTVDISAFLRDANCAEAQKIVDDVREACMTTGFFQIVGHGVPRSLQEAVFKGAEALFSLPLEVKKKLDKTSADQASNRGYEVIGNQSLQAGGVPDLKEGFYVGKDTSPDDPRAKAHPFFIGPNIWPDLPKDVFQQPMDAYYAIMHALSLQVLQILARGLPYGPDVFEEFTSNDAVAVMRLLHYPPATVVQDRQLGAGAHTDFGAITLLLQDEHSGLQVLNNATGDWVDIEPNSDAYVVNVGDMLDMWTSGRYKSNTHRVLCQNKTDRYSVPFFFDGNLESKLAPLDGSVGKKDAITVEEHMMERFASTYGAGK